jgi:gamma-glutamylcyclotransferase (GGCT)/AIG2-like uncharacterized protein YtfP
MQPAHLFVYGTLRRDLRSGMSRLLLKHSEFISYATFQGKLYNVDAYPGVVPSCHSSDRVVGEVYHLLKPDFILSRLDKYEECSVNFPEPTEYIRTVQQVQCINSETMSAWIYLYNHPVDKLPPLPSGDFIKQGINSR